MQANSTRHRPTIARVCRTCGAPFAAPLDNVKQGYGWFCSRTCARRSVPRLSPEGRFWPKVNKNGPIPVGCPELGPCWLWTGTRDKKGYGRVSPGGRAGTHLLAHRAAWALATGTPPPDDSAILHICDTPGCVRNDGEGWYEVRGILLPRRGHLALGTSAANTADASDKGRMAAGDAHYSRRVPGSVPHGERHWHAVLTEDLVRAIRLRYDQAVIKRGVQRAMAREYGLSESIISTVVHRRVWRHV